MRLKVSVLVIAASASCGAGVALAAAPHAKAKAKAATLIARGSSGKVKLVKGETLKLEFSQVLTDGGFSRRVGASARTKTATLKTSGKPTFVRAKTCGTYEEGCPEAEFLTLQAGGKGTVTLKFGLYPSGRGARATKLYTLSATVS